MTKTKEAVPIDEWGNILEVGEDIFAVGKVGRRIVPTKNCHSEYLYKNYWWFKYEKDATEFISNGCELPITLEF